MKLIRFGEVGAEKPGVHIDGVNFDVSAFIKEYVTKPVVGYVAGFTAPEGKTMGHAGAIVGGADDTTEAKKRIMRENGIHVVDSPAEIGKKVKEIMG